LKKILIFIDWFVPGYKAGGPISSNANLIDNLSLEYEFYVITRDTDYCVITPYTNVTSDAWNLRDNGARVYYFSSQRLSIRNLIKVSRTIEADVVYINGIYSFYFSLLPLIWFKYFTRKKVVVSARGMLSDHTFSSKKAKKQLFYAIARLTRLYKRITFHATNENEAAQIRKNVGFKGTIKVAPNLPPKAPAVLDRQITKKSGELRLISIARVSPEKNTLFALKILEKLTTDDGEKHTIVMPKPYSLIFDLYGTIYNQAYWDECQRVIQTLPSHITVNFCGALEKEKIHETLNQYHFLFMPSQGENYGHSIVESFLAGCPVIISDRTPWRNQPPNQTHTSFTLTHPHTPIWGWDLPLENPDAFVSIMDYCVKMEQDEYTNMSKSAFEYGQLISKDHEVLKANKQLFE
jgi:Glycosyltransferase